MSLSLDGDRGFNELGQKPGCIIDAMKLEVILCLVAQVGNSVMQTALFGTEAGQAQLVEERGSTDYLSVGRARLDDSRSSERWCEQPWRSSLTSFPVLVQLSGTCDRLELPGPRGSSWQQRSVLMGTAGVNAPRRRSRIQLYVDRGGLQSSRVDPGGMRFQGKTLCLSKWKILCGLSRVKGTGSTRSSE